MTALVVAAKDLKPGDVTRGSRQTIESIQTDGIYIRPGKVRLKLKTHSGHRREVDWGRETQIGIERPA